MKWIAPDYYREFHCIADQCRHSCCIGWVISIDSDTLGYYQGVGGNMGERLQEGIDARGEVAHFILGEGERCPFLNQRGLCDIISELGEEALCQICRDHPRYRNFYSDRTEIGLGLCCEAAGALILKKKEKMELLLLEEDGREEVPDEADLSLLEWRAKLIGIAQDRNKTVAERAECILQEADFRLPMRTEAEWADIYLKLERLEDGWTERLLELRDTDISLAATPTNEEWEIAFEQLLVYFLYRQLPFALEDGEYEGRAALAVLGYQILRQLCCVYIALHGAVELDNLVELARQYSAEIEYSDENVEALLDALYE